MPKKSTAKPVHQITPEEEFENKQRSKKRIRIILICVNALLICYLGYGVTMNIIHYFNRSTSKNDEDLITLCGLSKEKSLEIYAKYGLTKENDSFLNENSNYDYSFVGPYLNISPTSISPDNIATNHPHLSLSNVCSDISYEKNLDVFADGYLTSGINLFNPDIKTGDYLVISSSFGGDELKTKPLKIESDQMIYETFYTTPNTDGKRKRIIVKSRSSSPALVISVEDGFSGVPNGYYDVAVLSDLELTDEGIPENYSVALCSGSKKEQMLCAYKSRAPYVIKYDDVTDVTTSSLISFTNSNFLYNANYIEGPLAKMPTNGFIRELGGNIYRAGTVVEGIEETTYLAPFYSKLNRGQLVFLINKDDIVAQTEKLLPFIR